MKKKKMLRRLVISRETLLELERQDAKRAAGGGVTTPPDCQFSKFNQATCFTQYGDTCRTNLC